MTETKVLSLIADVSTLPKKVLGVRVKDKKGKNLTIRAKKALILANGGFGANPEIVERYDPSLKGFATTNIPGAATGECTMMALSLGADTDCINYIQIHPTVYAFEGKRGLISETLRENGGAILVNSDGERFVDEEQRRDVVAQTILKQKDKIAYLIISKETYHKKTDDYVKDGMVIQGWGALRNWPRKSASIPPGSRRLPPNTAVTWRRRTIPISSAGSTASWARPSTSPARSKRRLFTPSR